MPLINQQYVLPSGSVTQYKMSQKYVLMRNPRDFSNICKIKMNISVKYIWFHQYKYFQKSDEIKEKGFDNATKSEFPFLYSFVETSYRKYGDMMSRFHKKQKQSKLKKSEAPKSCFEYAQSIKF